MNPKMFCFITLDPAEWFQWTKYVSWLVQCAWFKNANHFEKYRTTLPEHARKWPPKCFVSYLSQFVSDRAENSTIWKLRCSAFQRCYSRPKIRFGCKVMTETIRLDRWEMLPLVLIRHSRWGHWRFACKSSMRQHSNLHFYQQTVTSSNITFSSPSIHEKNFFQFLSSS